MFQDSPLFHLLPVSRRGFLAAGGAGIVGLTLPEARAARPGSPGTVIQIQLNGGASQLETFDPKPHAPREVRGPLHSIGTSVPSLRFSECFPRLAERAHLLTVVRSLHHTDAPIHETGQQYLNSGQLIRKAATPVTLGEEVLASFAQRTGLPAALRVSTSATDPRQAIFSTGNHAAESPPLISLPNELPRTAGRSPGSKILHSTYGEHTFGIRFRAAARLAERGVRLIQVNTFDQLEGERTWDAHGDSQIGPATLFDYRDTFGPQLDQALSALIDDLRQSGLWSQTLIVCTGEMGRSSSITAEKGRDHSVQAWSGILAGGSLPGGQVIGETDEHAETIIDNPVHLAELAALIRRFLGLTPADPLATVSPAGSRPLQKDPLRKDTAQDSESVSLPQGVCGKSRS